jgi:hypothetical protein
MFGFKVICWALLFIFKLSQFLETFLTNPSKLRNYAKFLL